MSDKAASILEKLSHSERKKESDVGPEALVELAVQAMQDKKAKDIVRIDMREVSEITDYFLVCTGESDLQIKAIVDAVEQGVKGETGERPWRTEGYEHRQWVVIDYVDVVVHVFDKERRGYYNLERLWADAPTDELGPPT